VRIVIPAARDRRLAITSITLLIALTAQLLLPCCLLTLPLLAPKDAESTASRSALPAVTTRKMTSDRATGTILQTAAGLSLSALRYRCKQRQGGKTYSQDSHMTKLRSGDENVNGVCQVPYAACCLTCWKADFR
jgi:hypothetical protein